MARYALKLPQELKAEAEQIAEQQGISLNQFILWSVAEKVGSLRQGLDDPNYPHVAYRRGASGHPTPVVRGTGIRVQTIVLAAQHQGLSEAQTAAEYDLPVIQVRECLAFYAAHRAEVDETIRSEEAIETEHG